MRRGKIKRFINISWIYLLVPLKTWREKPHLEIRCWTWRICSWTHHSLGSPTLPVRLHYPRNPGAFVLHYCANQSTYPKPPVVPSFRRWDWGPPGCQEGPVIPNLRRYDWRCRIVVQPCKYSHPGVDRMWEQSEHREETGQFYWFGLSIYSRMFVQYVELLTPILWLFLWLGPARIHWNLFGFGIFWEHNRSPSMRDPIFWGDIKSIIKSWCVPWILCARNDWALIICKGSIDTVFGEYQFTVHCPKFAHPHDISLWHHVLRSLMFQPKS